jgi:PmbA protein
MTDARAALALAKKTLALVSGADQASVQVNGADAAYSRFARNYVVANLASVSTTVSVTFVKNKQQGLSTTGDLSETGLRAVVARASDVAAHVPANPEFVSLAVPGAIGASARSVFAATAEATPADRIAKLKAVFARMERSSLGSAGFTTTQAHSVAIANSLGVEAAWEGTYAGIEIKAIAERTSGYADFWTRDYAVLDAAERAHIAAAKATVSDDPAGLAPGTYTVILEPPAFVDCINNLYYGFAVDKIKESQDSWLIDRLDKPLFSPNLTVIDDWSYPGVANQPFASDGAPTQRVVLVEKGVPKGIVSSTYLANKFGVENDRHAGNQVARAAHRRNRARDPHIANLVYANGGSAPVHDHGPYAGRGLPHRKREAHQDAEEFPLLHIDVERACRRGVRGHAVSLGVGRCPADAARSRREDREVHHVRSNLVRLAPFEEARYRREGRFGSIAVRRVTAMGDEHGLCGGDVRLDRRKLRGRSELVAFALNHEQRAANRVQ